MATIKHNFESDEILSNNLTELSSDIVKVDNKLSDIDQLILDLKNNVNRAQQLLHTAAQADKVNIYKIINASMEMLATYYQTYNKFMELKFRYRSEYDNMSFKTAHFIRVELTKLDKKSDANYYEMIEFLKNLSNATSASPTLDKQSSGMTVDMQAEIQSLDTDDIYTTS